MEENNRGTVFCIGVGPGDPELMTLKAVRLIRECGVIAAAGSRIEDSAAFQIAIKAVPEIGQKTALPIDMPMTRDPEVLAKAHRKGADLMEAVLKTGQDIGYLILGDPSIYGSFTYLHRILVEDGYEVVFCSGVTSFSAAAARLGISLAEGDEELRILPGAGHDPADIHKGNTVIMKAGAGTGKLKEILKSFPADIYFAEKVGREGERVAFGAGDIPDDAGYMSLIILNVRFTKY